MYAVELGMSAPPQARPQRTLVQLVEKLEATKPRAGLVDPVTDFRVCREFALSVYARADRADRSGQVGARQVEAFSAAGTFLKALAHFGPLDADLESRQQYAEWRAWDLATAIQAGRAPTRVDHRGEGTPRTATATATATGTGMATMAQSPSSPSPSPSPSSPSPFAAPSPVPPPPSAPAYPSLDGLDLNKPPPPPPPPPAPHQTPSSPSPSPPSPPSSPSRNVPAMPLPSQPRGAGASAAGSRLEPEWGRGGPFSPGDEVLYSSGHENGGFQIARVLEVDASVVPPAYVVRVNGAERSTEASRLAAPPSPGAKAKESNPRVVGSKYTSQDGVEEDEHENASADGMEKKTSVAVEEAKRQPPPPPPPPRDPSGAEIAPGPGAVASAHELAMEAAGLLSPSDGDPARALHLLRRAVATLEGGR